MKRSLLITAANCATAVERVRLPAPLCLTLLQQARQLHLAGLKAFGVLIADPATSDHPFRPTDVVFFDPRKNRRNEPDYRAAFEAQGDYFRRFDDAGFVADPVEVLAVWRAVEQSGKEIVAPFHIHRRQPANFSLIDYRLHNPAFTWHLILSLRDPTQPVLRAFRVRKDISDYGITAHDAGQDSELPYQGPEVTDLRLTADGPATALRRLSTILAPTEPETGEPSSWLAGNRVTTDDRPRELFAAG